MKRVMIVSAVILAIPAIVIAAPAPKYFVCKYVGQPGVNETLQTGQNPISVSGNAIAQPVVVGAYFNDAQGRSYVVAEDTGQPEPSCPIPQNPVDVCPNIEGNQATVPEGKELKDGQCVDKETPKEEPPVTPPVVTNPPAVTTPAPATPAVATPAVEEYPEVQGK